MKKVIPIILVLTMAFAFSITALADDVEDEVDEVEIEVLPPVDPGEFDSETREYDNLDLELEEPPENVEAEIYGWAEEDLDQYWPGHEEYVSERVEEYKKSDAYDKDIPFDAIQVIAATYVFDPVNEVEVTGVGGWITVTNYKLGYDTLKAILQYFEGLDGFEYRLITEFEYDPVTGTLKFFVDDLGFWSMFFALIERGVDPATAARVANARSPQTSDNSIHAGIILLFALSAAAATVVIAKKARNHN